jgi:ABC-2 type transport system permease protein
MAVGSRSMRASAAAPRVPPGARLVGLGSVFGKTLRDARGGIVVVGGLLALMVAGGGISMSQTYATPETRLELAAMSTSLPPLMRGMYGNPVNVDTLGGFVSWHYGAYLALLGGLWSILALSSTLAGEAQRGSLDFVAATARSRRAIALEKAAGHVAALGIAMATVSVTAWLTGALAGTMTADAIPPDAAVAFGVGIGIRALVAGSVAFALAPFLGRGAAAGIAGAVMLGGYVVNSYRAVVPAFDAVATASWFSWTADHLPLAGRTDWAGVALASIACAGLIAVGVEAFARRDIGVTGAMPFPGLPRSLLGVHGPMGRSFGDLLPTALAWGAGLGAYGFLMAAASRSLLDALDDAPGMTEIFRNLIPGIDISTAAGFLQLAFADLGFVLVGLATASFISARSTDETSRRLELLLATPLTRARWAVASGLAVWLAIGLVTAMLAAAIAVGVLSTGQEPATPAVGALVLAAYGVAVSGIGVAAAGVSRAGLGVPAVLAMTVGTFLVDLFAPILRFPDWVAQLALTTHLGQPMVGAWDPAGLVACAALATGGLAVGAWGMRRRDVVA